jgi:hypothetical protein
VLPLAIASLLPGRSGDAKCGAEIGRLHYLAIAHDEFDLAKLRDVL